MKPAPTAPRPTLPPGVLPPDQGVIELFSKTFTENRKQMLALLDEQPMLLVFLRHFGDSFCRETLHDVSKAMPLLQTRKVRPVFVHMGSPERARPFFARFSLASVERVSDPEMKLYSAPEFHLLKSTVLPHFFGATAYVTLFQRALWRYGAGSPGKEDPTQLPGVFFLKDRAIYRAFRHKHLPDRPDYGMFGA